jgi:hypothetical protein
MDDSHLDQMVQHERSYTGASPFRVGENVGNVRFIIRDIGHHEGKSDDQVTVENHAAKVWIFQAFCHCPDNKLSLISLKKFNRVKLTINSRPEEFPAHGTDGWNVMRLNVTVINRPAAYVLKFRITLTDFFHQLQF